MMTTVADEFESEHLSVQHYLDKVLATYSQGARYEEVRRAKEEFFNRAGKVAEGSEQFELQMKAFIDWYLFDRPLDQVDLCPVKMYVLEYGKTLPPEEVAIFQDVTQSIHSIFEFLKVREEDVFLKDLFSGEKYVVEDSSINRGFTKGDVFEARLIRFKDRYVFGGSFIFHPVECKSYIKKQIKKIRYLDEKQRLKLMHRLAAMRLKTDQYSHIDVKYIYTDNPLF
jgi:hypothetical protein